MENRSKAILGMEDSAFARSLFKSMGYTDSELKEGKPLIGIANTWNTLVPGHYNLDKVAEYVKNGIYAAGGTAVEFGTIAACDGVAQGHEGMHYILPSREIICDSVEIMAQAHRLDGLVLLASCDKIVPAMLMAAARLDIPCIVCVGGPMPVRSPSASTTLWRTPPVPAAAPVPSLAPPTPCAACPRHWA